MAQPLRGIFEPLEHRRLLSSTTLDFEHLPVGPVAPGSGVYDDPSGYRIEARRGTGGPTNEAFHIYGQPQGYASKILHPNNWGDAFLISRTDGLPFSLDSFDYAAGRHNEAGDLIVTGTFVSGATEQQQASFNSKNLSTLNLDWINLNSIHIAFAGGVNDVFGALDNFVLRDRTTDGGVATGYNELGRTLVEFHGYNWGQFDRVVPLADGGAYVVGQRGAANISVPWSPSLAYPSPTGLVGMVARLTPDGMLDSTFSDDGIAPTDELGWDGMPIWWSLEFTPIAGGSGGFLITSPGHAAKLTPEFELDTGFGDAGHLNVQDGLQFRLRADGALVLLGREEGVDFLELYTPGGELVPGSRQDLAFLSDAGLTARDLDLDASGNVYVTAGGSGDPGNSGSGPSQAVIARTTPDFQPDASYGVGGFASVTFDSTDVFNARRVFVSDEGRAVLYVSEDDGYATFGLFDADGVRVRDFRNPFGTPLAGDSDPSFSPQLIDVHFGDDGSWNLVGRYNTSGGNVFLSSGNFWPVIGLTRFLADGSRDNDFGWNGAVAFLERHNPITPGSAAFSADGVLYHAGLDLLNTFNSAGDLILAMEPTASLRRFELPGEPAQTVVVNVESTPIGPLGLGTYVDSGFVFTNRDGSGQNKRLHIYGTLQGYSSKVIHPDATGHRIEVKRWDSAPFNLASFDHAGSHDGVGGDFTLTGRFLDGSSQQQTVAFDGSLQMSTLDIDWQNLLSFEVDYAGGSSPSYGALDNFVFGTDVHNPPTSTGFDQDNRALLTYSSRNWNEVEQVIQLPDGSYYAFGRDGTVANPFPQNQGVPYPPERQRNVAKLRPDGTLDPSFGDEGVKTLAEIGIQDNTHPRLLHDVQLTGDGKLLISLASGTAIERMVRGVIKFNLDLTPVTSFGDDGTLMLDEPALLTLFPDGGFATVTKIATGGGTLRVFDASGAPTGTSVALPDAIQTGRIDYRAVTRGSDGSMFLAFLKPSTSAPLPQGLPAHGVIRLRPDYTHDTSYGDGGFVLRNFTPEDGISPRLIFAADDGRVVVYADQWDSKSMAFYLDPAGVEIVTIENPAGAPGYAGHSSWSPLFSLSFRDDGGFVVVGDVQRGGYNPLLIQDTWTQFAVRRYTQAGTLDTSFGDDGGITYGTYDEPVFLIDAEFDADGHLIMGGHDEFFVLDFPMIQDYARLGSLRTLALVDGPPPALVTSSRFEFETGQTIVFTFNVDVGASLGREDLALVNLTTGQTIGSSVGTFEYDPATLQGTFAFGGDLADGNYRATLPAGSFANPTGAATVYDFNLDFYVLAGDANRDRSVNLADLAILRANFGQTGRTFSQGDFNYDSVVNLQDLAILRGNFGIFLPPHSGDRLFGDGGGDEDEDGPG